MLVLTNQQQKITIHFEGWIFISLRWVMMTLSRKNYEFITKFIPWSPSVLLLETTFENMVGTYISSPSRFCCFLILHRFLTCRASSLGSDLCSVQSPKFRRAPQGTSPVVQWWRPHTITQVRSLVGELRSHMHMAK